MTESRNLDPFGDRDPPGTLQERITRSLHAGGLIESGAVRVRRRIIRGGAMLALVVTAFAAGRLQRNAVETRPNFLLLLYDDSSYRDDRPIREIVAEYGAWADSLRRERTLVLGEKLADAYAELPPAFRTQPATDRPSGLFIVRANDMQAAASVAGTSPHLRYGGRIVIHQIEH